VYYFLNARVTSVFSEIFREQETSKENDQIRSAKSHTLEVIQVVAPPCSSFLMHKIKLIHTTLLPIVADVRNWHRSRLTSVYLTHYNPAPVLCASWRIRYGVLMLYVVIFLCGIVLHGSFITMCKHWHGSKINTVLMTTRQICLTVLTYTCTNTCMHQWSGHTAPKFKNRIAPRCARSW